MSALDQIFMPFQNQAVTRTFGALALPVPQTGEYLAAATEKKKRPGGIVFHPTAGLVFRCTTGEMHITNPLVIPLIGCAYQDPPEPESYANDTLSISIFPGLRVSRVMTQNLDWLKENLSLEWNDPQLGNIGLIPVTSYDCPRGIPVISDPDYLRLLGTGQNLTDDQYAAVTHKAFIQIGANRTEAAQWVHGIESLRGAWKQVQAHTAGTEPHTECLSKFYVLAGNLTGSGQILKRDWERPRLHTDVNNRSHLKSLRANEAALNYKERISNSNQPQ